jgi:glycosyltransferase involved in cell wall biosynthesis
MQIALNARFYAHRPTGMQRYAIELCRRFATHLAPVRPAHDLRGAAGHLWEQVYLPSAVGGRLLWSPNNTGPLAIAHQVCTIHDLIPIDRPEWFTANFSRWYQWLMPRLARRVRHLIAISEYTRQRASALLGVPEEKITVIPNGVGARFSPRSTQEIEDMRKTLGLPGPYLLCVGSLEPRKNIPRLLQAWGSVQGSVDRKVELVIGGACGNSRVFGQVNVQSIPPRTRMTGYIPDHFLPALYSGALALVYPSLYEGFGLPPLEAMACGTPVVTSNSTSLPEVVARCAILVDPENVDSIAGGIEQVLSSSSLRDTLRQAGIARAHEYSWERCAASTLRLLLQHSEN